MSCDVDLTAFEGLIFRTAAMYAPLLDDEVEDVQQVLRLNVWQAAVSFDGSRVRKHSKLSAKEQLERYVFMCLRNRVKDLLKGQERLNARRNGRQLFIEELTDDLDYFNGQYLAAEDQDIEALVQDVIELPSTLSRMERDLVALLLLDMSRTEISLRLKLTPKKVLAAHRSIQVKLSDWGSPDLELPEVLVAA